MSRHENQNKKRKHWCYVYRKFGITQRFNVDDPKGEVKKEVEVDGGEKSYIWRDIMKALTFYFYILQPNLCLYRFALAFLLFIVVDLTFDKMLNIYEKSHSRYLNS